MGEVAVPFECDKLIVRRGGIGSSGGAGEGGTRPKLAREQDVKLLHATEHYRLHPCEQTTNYVPVRDLQRNGPSSALACRFSSLAPWPSTLTKPFSSPSPQLITRPCHSIINQAFSPRLRLDPRRPINGDGFGVGWYDSVYDPELGSQPCIFVSSVPVSVPTFSLTFGAKKRKKNDKALGRLDLMAPFRLGIAQTSFDWPKRSSPRSCCKHSGSNPFSPLTRVRAASCPFTVDTSGRRLQDRSRWIIVTPSTSKN